MKQNTLEDCLKELFIDFIGHIKSGVLDGEVEVNEIESLFHEYANQKVEDFVSSIDWDDVMSRCKEE